VVPVNVFKFPAAPATQRPVGSYRPIGAGGQPLYDSDLAAEFLTRRWVSRFREEISETYVEPCCGTLCS